AQISQAVPMDRVTFQVAQAEQSPLEDGSADVVTVAQAVHWFDLERFYAEVRRVSRPGGVLAVWCYSYARISPEGDPLVKPFDADVMRPYWPAQTELVEKELRTLPFPFDEIAPPAFDLVVDWQLDDLVGYCSSWSAAKRFRDANGYDAVAQFREKLAAAWG